MELALLEIMTIIRNKSANTYLVGGCVRDMLLGREPKDFDIVTDASIEELSHDLIASGWELKGVGDHFLVNVVSKNGNVFEIANFRKEAGFSDGRRPDKVEIGTLQEDAARRDFTVNSIYFDPFNGQYIDPNDGIKDLKAKILRFIGKPRDRIKEDYLRVFRFYRFLAKLGFEGHPKSLSACREMFNEAYRNTTPERVRVEIERIVL
jgi:tRNA nucleotidyltransferase/poly(A) polymerase